MERWRGGEDGVERWRGGGQQFQGWGRQQIKRTLEKGHGRFISGTETMGGGEGSFVANTMMANISLFSGGVMSNNLVVGVKKELKRHWRFTSGTATMGGG